MLVATVGGHHRPCGFLSTYTKILRPPTSPASFLLLVATAGVAAAGDAGDDCCDACEVLPPMRPESARLLLRRPALSADCVSMNSSSTGDRSSWRSLDRRCRRRSQARGLSICMISRMRPRRCRRRRPRQDAQELATLAVAGNLSLFSCMHQFYRAPL